MPWKSVFEEVAQTEWLKDFTKGSCIRDIFLRTTHAIGR